MSFPIGFFGVSTGAASALRVAAQLPGIISAVVSRGGRPDLAAGYLDKVKSPILLIVGSQDKELIVLNRKALSLLNDEKKIEIIDGASHSFEEPGTINIVAEMASDWFTTYLRY
jgi:dienelactone hydrolase